MAMIMYTIIVNAVFLTTTTITTITTTITTITITFTTMIDIMKLINI